MRPAHNMKTVLGSLRWKGWSCLVAIVLLSWLTIRSGSSQNLQHLLEWISRQGVVGIIVYVLVYIVACVFLVPGSLLTIGAGIVFGLAKGIPIASLGATLGASAAFLLGRRFARDSIKKRIRENPRFIAIDEAVARDGWKFVGLTRLSPVFPFGLLNYAFAFSGVRFRDYFVASWIGMLPGTVLYVYVGSLLRSVGDIGKGNQARSPAEWAYLALGLVATVWVTASLTKIAKRELRGKLKMES